MSSIILSYNWQSFDGHPQKKVQDIKLSNGEVYTSCWPYTGYWHCCKQKPDGTFATYKIPIRWPVQVKLNFDFYN